MEDPLIPGLPDEIARECLYRVPYTGFPTVKSVSKLWRDEISSDFFHRSRKAVGVTKTLVVMAQSDQSSRTSSNKEKLHSSSSPSYRLILYEPITGDWSTLPPIPGLFYGLPLFCQIAAAGRSVVVVGGWDPATWEASDKVFVFDFLSAEWRRGENMPGPRRSFFACASDLDRTMFVAGGHDEEKNALRSAMAYDVESDAWVPLPDMRVERDECKGVFSDGHFRVLGGYSTESQGQFGKSTESFDVSQWEWGPLEEETSDVGTCPRTSVADLAGKGRLYRCKAGRMEVKEDLRSTWTAVIEIPEEVKVAPWVVAVEEGSLLVVGSACHGGKHEGYVLDVKNERWTKLDLPEEFSGHVQAGCSLYI